MNAIAVSQLHYEEQNFTLSADFCIKSGECVAIIGKSGSGKSTLLNLIAGFIDPTQGRIILLNEDVTHKSPQQRPIAMLFQENNVFPHLTVKQNLALGLSSKLKLIETEQKQLLAVAKQLEIDEFLMRKPNELSGGQKQRVAIGRCLLMNRPILMLDEPFSSLDPELKQTLLALIRSLQEEYQFTLVTVTHQHDDINQLHDRVIVLNNGIIEFDGRYHDYKNQK